MHVDIIERVSLKRKEKKRKGKNDGVSLECTRRSRENQRSGDAAIATDIENRKKTGLRIASIAIERLIIAESKDKSPNRKYVKSLSRRHLFHRGASTVK
jgi:hypothetical protein